MNNGSQCRIQKLHTSVHRSPWEWRAITHRRNTLAPSAADTAKSIRRLPLHPFPPSQPASTPRIIANYSRGSCSILGVIHFSAFCCIWYTPFRFLSQPRHPAFLLITIVFYSGMYTLFGLPMVTIVQVCCHAKKISNEEKQKFESWKMKKGSTMPTWTDWWHRLIRMNSKK